PDSTPITPTSLMPDSAQLRGQPDTANFTLCGAYIRHSARSSSLPIVVESCVPNRHQSLPTQVFTVRSAFAYACPDGMPRSAQICGKSSFFAPSKSMRWPPVTLTVGILYLSTTKAMRRNSEADVSPPHIRGTTENVPFFWMLACARSLMKRDCGSSSTSCGHVERR